MAHWRSHHRHHPRRRHRDRYREVNSGVPIWQQIIALILFTVSSCVVALYVGAGWLALAALVVWFFALEWIVRQARGRG